MNPKRDRLAIIHDMLQIISSRGNKMNPTQIMYKANLSHQMLGEYLNEIMSKGFVAEEIDKKGKKTYSLTEKGFGFLKDFEIIKKFFDSYGLN